MTLKKIIAKISRFGGGGGPQKRKRWNIVMRMVLPRGRISNITVVILLTAIGLG